MDLNIGLVVEAVAAAVPEREALVWRDRRLPYAAFAERCRRLSAVLGGLGLGAKGDPDTAPAREATQDLVLLHLTNCPEYLEAMVGAYLGDPDKTAATFPVVAVLALRPGVDAVADDELRDACGATLARYKLPKAFVRVDAVQRTPAGKSDYAWARSVVAP